MLKSIANYFQVNWKKSSYKFFLTTFLVPRKDIDFPVMSKENWHNILEEDPIVVTRYLEGQGLIQRASLEAHLKESFNNEELKQFLRDSGLSTQGRKDDLVSRLIQHDSAKIWHEVSSEPGIFIYECTERGRKIARSHLQQLSNPKARKRVKKAGFSDALLVKYLAWVLTSAISGIIGNQAYYMLVEFLKDLREKLTTSEPAETPEPTQTPEPTETPNLTETPEPTQTPEPTETPNPTETHEPTQTPEPTETPNPTETHEPTQTPEPTETPNPTETSEPTQTPEPTETLNPTETSEPTQTPEPTKISITTPIKSKSGNQATPSGDRKDDLIHISSELAMEILNSPQKTEQVVSDAFSELKDHFRDDDYDDRGDDDRDYDDIFDFGDDDNDDFDFDDDRDDDFDFD